MAKSILQDTKECYVCRMFAEAAGYYDELPSTGLHRHHTVYGKGNRPLAERYGLWVYLCARLHHEYGEAAVHNNRGIRIMLSKISQKAFEIKHPDISFLDVFGIRYLEPGEEFRPDIHKAMTSGSKLNVHETVEDACKENDSGIKIEFIDTGLEDGLPF